jgi:hypothetical protein
VLYAVDGFFLSIMWLMHAASSCRSCAAACTSSSRCVVRSGWCFSHRAHACRQKLQEVCSGGNQQQQHVSSTVGCYLLASVSYALAGALMCSLMQL